MVGVSFSSVFTVITVISILFDILSWYAHSRSSWGVRTVTIIEYCSDRLNASWTITAVIGVVLWLLQ